MPFSTVFALASLNACHFHFYMWGVISSALLYPVRKLILLVLLFPLKYLILGFLARKIKIVF